MKILDLYEADDENLDDVPEDSGEAPQEYSNKAEIKAEVFPALQQTIGKLNKKAEKLGVPPIQLKVTREFFQQAQDERGQRTGAREKYYDVEIYGQAPRLEGYKFIATVEHREAGNIIRMVPGQDENEDIRAFYESRPDYCDHCKKRRARVDTYIVQDPDGELRQIGRNCLKDFFGTTNPKMILWYFSLLDHIQDAVQKAKRKSTGRGLYRRGDVYFTAERVLALAAMATRLFGYRRSADGFSGSTSQMVRFGLGISNPSTPDEYQYDHTMKKPTTPQDEQLAKDILAWWETVPESQKETNNFFHSIDMVLKSGDVPSRDIGYIIAMIPTYNRAMGNIKPKQQKSNVWIGTPNGKIAATPVKVIRTREISGPYGNSQLVSTEDAAGNSIAWFNNSSTRYNEGDSLTITGTVKKHDEYNGRKQTMLTRVKVQ